MKYLAGYLIAAFVLLLASCAVPASDSMKNVSGYSGNPELIIDSFPAYGSGDVVYGKLLNADPSLYKLTAWICVNGGWWPKYTYAQWYFLIPTNGIWSYNFVSYYLDRTASYIIIYLIPIDYPSYTDRYTEANDSITYTVINRYDAAYGAAPQISVTNAVSNVLNVYYVQNFTNLTICFRASDDYYLEGVGVVHGNDDRYFQYYKTEKTTIFTQTTNVLLDFILYPGSNTIRYYAKDQGMHYSSTNTLIVNCVPFKLPEATCDVLLSPNLFTVPHTMVGTVKSDTEIAAVYAFTNGVPLPVTGTTNWSAGITTELGNPTLLTVYCVDIYGVSSVTQSTLVHYGFGGWDH